MNGPSIFSAANLSFLESLHARYKEAPEQLDSSWRYLFQVIEELERVDSGSRSARPGAPDEERALRADTVRLHGHRLASLNPIAPRQVGAETELMADQLDNAGDAALLIPVYCNTLTAETAHIDSAGIRHWLYSALEASQPITDEDRRAIVHQLIKAERLEALLGRRYPSKKRFGAEGAESIVPLLARLIETAAARGIEHVVIATMHRGRLNILANVLDKPLVELLAEFKGKHPFPGDGPRAADVPYHLGYEGEVVTRNGRIKVTLTPNPSHLEAVNAVGLGRARALQDTAGERGEKTVLPLVIHTDASVVGQGVVAELIQLSGVTGFDVGGTIHLIINNQIGFTTEPADARTSKYCTGPWKAIDSAILHVNADDPEAACKAADIAVAFRQEHGKDAVIDLVCYRRNGHNEIDDPTFTQPLQYAAIEKHPTVLQRYGQMLTDRRLTNSDELQRLGEAYSAGFSDAEQAADAFHQTRSGYRSAPRRPSAAEVTGCPIEQLSRIAAVLASLPDGFQGHPRIHRLLDARRFDGDRGVAWPLAEALAFGSVLQDGIPVRLTGQDVVRGAFSQRHFKLFDHANGTQAFALNRVDAQQARFSVFDSPLSEYAVLGFEYGYSLERTQGLVIWEAQFGDFANGAQIVVDQFITSGEEKWCSASGLILLLPHGLEGQGPEHSSARLERYLQLAANDNVCICNPSTPANYFHMLRRQALSGARKPLIVTAPKKLLRLPAAVSRPEEFGPGTRFRPVLADFVDGAVDLVLLCTGKIAYELEAERTARNARNAAVVRLEQLYPFPADELMEYLRKWPGARVAWLQEEPENMGAWRWVERQLRTLAEGGDVPSGLTYIGRPEAGSPAGSFHGDHDRDQADIVDRALRIPAHRGRARLSVAAE
jgi:2-oxoglutarate dehydrogenase E1 component